MVYNKEIVRCCLHFVQYLIGIFDDTGYGVDSKFQLVMMLVIKKIKWIIKIQILDATGCIVAKVTDFRKN